MAEGENENENDEAELEGGRMTFLKHVELRDRVRNAAFAFIGAFLVCWYFADKIFAWLRQPLFNIRIQHCNSSEHTPQCLAYGLKPADDWGVPKLIFTGRTGYPSQPVEVQPLLHRDRVRHRCGPDPQAPTCCRSS